MTAGDALYAAIVADPTDVVSRLVYADWLEEQGGFHCLALGAFIRRQLAAGWELRTTLPVSTKINEHLLHILSIGLPDDSEVVLRGGFISEVHTTLDAWLRNGRRLVKESPIQRVTLQDRKAFHDVYWPHEKKFVWCTYSPGENLTDATDLPHWLAPCIFDRLDTAPEWAGVTCIYRSAELADSALSLACQDWARGKPPLRTPERHFDMDGTQHDTPQGCCTAVAASRKGNSPCERCGGFCHYQPLHGGYFIQCEECWHTFV